MPQAPMAHIVRFRSIYDDVMWSYVGPFSDRAAAETWVKAQFGDNKYHEWIIQYHPLVKPEGVV